MSAVAYVMSAEENYTSVIAGQFSNSTAPNFCTCNEYCLGTAFDRVRRNIMYWTTITSQTADPDQFSAVYEVNATGKTLWSGHGATPPGNTIDLCQEFTFQTAAKNIDSGSVTFYPAYDASKTVPSGKGSGGVTSFTLTSGTSFAFGTTEPNYLTGGTGEGASAAVTGDPVTGVVTGVTLWNIGHGYTVGDRLYWGTAGQGYITVDAVNSGSDGSWGRSVVAGLSNGNSNLGLFGGSIEQSAVTDPRTGNFWCAPWNKQVHCFQRSNNYASTIGPLEIARNSGSANAAPIGTTANWAYVYANSNATPGVSSGQEILVLPSTPSSSEISADALTATYTYAVPDSTYRLYQTDIFPWGWSVGADSNLYIFASKNTTKAFKLWKCVPGSGFTDLTPWSSSTGPNSDCASWVQTAFGGNAILQLPNDLVLLSCLAPGDYTGGAGGTVATLGARFRIDCTYYNLSGATFDYHEHMVGGFMDANWAVTDQAGAAYLVTGCDPLDIDLDRSDYVHSVDYTVRRFRFDCIAMSGGSIVDASNYHLSVFVDYKFTYGSAPQVVSVIPETGWDTVYTGYAGTLGRSQVVSGSQYNQAVAGGTSGGLSYPDSFAPGIWDRTGNAIWLAAEEPVWCKFNTTFAVRYNQCVADRGDTTSSATSPFMKLSFADPALYCVPFCIGKTYCSKGQILRPVTPNESMTQTGPSLGKYRRATSSGVLFNDAQGVKVGVDFMTMRTCDFKSTGGTVSIPLTETFSGIYWSPVDANSNYDNMWCWEVCRPYPCTVVAVELQHKANENV